MPSSEAQMPCARFYLLSYICIVRCLLVLVSSMQSIQWRPNWSRTLNLTLHCVSFCLQPEHKLILGNSAGDGGRERNRLGRKPGLNGLFYVVKTSVACGIGGHDLKRVSSIVRCFRRRVCATRARVQRAVRNRNTG